MIQPKLAKKILETLNDAFSKFSPADQKECKEHGKRLAEKGVSWHPDPDKDYLSYGYDVGRSQSIKANKKPSQQAR